MGATVPSYPIQPAMQLPPIDIGEMRYRRTTDTDIRSQWIAVQQAQNSPSLPIMFAGEGFGGASGQSGNSYVADLHSRGFSAILKAECRMINTCTGEWGLAAMGPLPAQFLHPSSQTTSSPSTGSDRNEYSSGDVLFQASRYVIVRSVEKETVLRRLFLLGMRGTPTYQCPSCFASLPPPRPQLSQLKLATDNKFGKLILQENRAVSANR